MLDIVSHGMLDIVSHGMLDIVSHVMVAPRVMLVIVYYYNIMLVKV